MSSVITWYVSWNFDSCHARTLGGSRLTFPEGIGECFGCQSHVVPRISHLDGYNALLV